MTGAVRDHVFEPSTCPSTWPLLHGSAAAASTAARSRHKLRASGRSSLAWAAASHGPTAAASPAASKARKSAASRRTSASGGAAAHPAST